MTAWLLADGTRLVLFHHNPETWAEKVRDQLLALGCSAAYAEQAASRIRTAVLP
jgi:hypothetical protein